MDIKDKQKIINSYTALLNKYGVSEKALQWGEKGRSNLRFEVLLS
jgi:hypothetical protein